MQRKYTVQKLLQSQSSSKERREMRKGIAIKASSLLLLQRGGERSLFFSSPLSNNVRRHCHHLVRRSTTRLLCFRSLSNRLRDEVPSVPTLNFSSFCTQRWFSSSSSKISNADETPSCCKLFQDPSFSFVSVFLRNRKSAAKLFLFFLFDLCCTLNFKFLCFWS